VVLIIFIIIGGMSAPIGLPDEVTPQILEINDLIDVVE